MTDDYLALIALSELNFSFRQSYALMQQYQEVAHLFYQVDLQTLQGVISSGQIDRWQNLRIKCPTIKDLSSYLHKQLIWLRTHSVHLLTCHDDEFPPQLNLLKEGPGWLWVWGNKQCLADPAIAIVGGRNASSGGLGLAREYARTLAASGFNIISGLALGIDSASHQGALDVGGDTIAVLGSGLGLMYPSKHQYLADEIIHHHGAILSPWPLFQTPFAYQFPARNRIVSGLSLGVLVVEAAHKSGSLITARAALEQGKEVFALPSQVNNKRAQGNLNLIRQGAQLVYEPQQIIAELMPQITWHHGTKVSPPASVHTKPARLPEPNIPQDLQSVWQLFSDEPLSIDIICQKLALPYDGVVNQVMQLILLGVLTECYAGYEKTTQHNR